VRELKDLAAPLALEFARELAPGGRVQGHYYVARSPLRADRHSGSFAVWIKGSAAGAWKDFATDDKGDLVDLIAEVKYGGRDRTQRGSAIAFLRARLGLGGASPKTLSEARVRAQAERRARDAREAEERERKRRRVQELWLKGTPLGGTPGETYLRARGVEAAKIPNLSATFRFVPRLDWWKGGGSVHVGPAIVGRYRTPRGAMPAIHGTWLSDDGLGKADLDPPKLSFGPYAGCFLPIARGETGLEPWDDPRPGPVIVTEGPEDAWTEAQARPDLRVWAAGSLSNIGNLPCPPCVSAFLVVRQNDWQTPAAVKAFDRALEALARHGAPVAAIGVSFGKDPNDQLRGATG